MISKKKAIILQLVVLVVIAGALGYYFYRQANQKSPLGSKELHQIEFRPDPDFPKSMIEQYQERFNFIKQQIENEPNELTHWLALASTMKAIQSYDQAEEVWLYITEKWPDDPTAFANLGDLYANFLPDYPKAEWAFKQAIAKTENINEHLIFYRNLHRLYQQKYQEKTDLADDILFEALEKYPDEPDFLTLLADYYQNEGDKEKAIEYYEKLLKVDPLNQEAKRELEKLKE